MYVCFGKICLFCKTHLIPMFKFSLMVGSIWFNPINQTPRIQSYPTLLTDSGPQFAPLPGHGVVDRFGRPRRRRLSSQFRSARGRRIFCGAEKAKRRQATNASWFGSMESGRSLIWDQQQIVSVRKQFPEHQTAWKHRESPWCDGSVEMCWVAIPV